MYYAEMSTNLSQNYLRNKYKLLFLELKNL